MTDPTPTRAEVVLRRLREPAFGTETTERNLMAEAADMIQALRERSEAAEAELHTMKTAGIIEVAVRNPSVMECMQHWEGRVERAERDEAAAWNDAIEAVEALEPLGRRWISRARIRALRRAAPTEGEA